MRVCLDTNVLVAAFATRGLCSDVLRAVLAEHELVTGDVLLEEFRRVLREKLKVGEDALRLAESVFEGAQHVSRPAEPSDLAIADEDDRWVMATAAAGRADVLVTGDSDLLAVAATAPLTILTPREFWETLRDG